MARRYRGLHAGGLLRLDADHPDFGAQELDERGNARCQAPAADRHVDGADRARMLAQQLHADRALAGNDIGVVERMHHHIAVFLGQFGRMGARGVKSVAKQHHFAAQPAYGAHLDDRRGCRHHHDSADAQSRCRKCHALRVIAGRGADDPPGALLGRQLRDTIVRPANLEREYRLHVFALEQHFGAQPRRQQVHGFKRRLLGHFIDR